MQQSIITTHSRITPGLTAVLLAFGLLAWSASAPLAAHANRFGPPWMAEVAVDRVEVLAEPDSSSVVGPLERGAIVIVLQERGDWVRIPVGWLRGESIREKTDPYVGEVTDQPVVLHAKPDAKSEVRATAEPGALLWVMGVSPGLEGDQEIWWATTRGYVRTGALRGSQNEWAGGMRLPTAAESRNGWWGRASSANVRVGPTTDAPILGEFAGGERVKVLAEEAGEDVQGSDRWYRIDGGRYPGGYLHASLIERLPEAQPVVAPAPGDAQVGDGPWLIVDRASHTLTLLRNGQPEFTTLVALGKAGKDTPEGAYVTWGKYRADDMSSAANADAESPYDLPNVPYVQYYRDGGYALHGTYWHDDFGTDQSQGCVNLTWSDAAYLFEQTRPDLAADQASFVTGDATPLAIRG